MRYTLTIQQPKAIEWELTLTEAIVFSFCYELPSWAEQVESEIGLFYFASRNKIMEELPLVAKKPDTVYRIYKQLQEKGLIEWQKIGKKDCVRLTKKGKEWNAGKLGKKSELEENSEKNPNKLGKKSEFNSEKNPTNNNTSINNNTIDKNNTPDGVFFDNEIESSVDKVLERLNELSGRKLPINGERGESNRSKARALFKKNYTEAEILEVIQLKCFEWCNNPNMFQYLHPTTLFRPSNFKTYLDLLNDLKSNPEKANLFKKKINGSKGAITIISEQTKRDAFQELIDEGYFDNQRAY